MLSRWGLGRTLGPGGVSHESQLSVHSQRLLDAEVLETLHASHARARALLRRHRRQLRAVAEALTRQDTLTAREFDKVLEQLVAGRGNIKVRHNECIDTTGKGLCHKASHKGTPPLRRSLTTAS